MLTKKQSWLSFNSTLYKPQKKRLLIIFQILLIYYQRQFHAFILQIFLLSQLFNSLF